MLWHGLVCENGLHMLRYFRSTNVMNSLAQKIGLNNKPYLNYFRCGHFNAEIDINFPTHGRLSPRRISVAVHKCAKKRTLNTDWHSNAIHWKVYINLCCLHIFYAVYLASPFVIPDSIFALANVSCIINVTVRNIFIFFNPLIVCFSNWKSRSIRPFTLSMLVLFLYSLLHFFEFLATYKGCYV